tara:strand:- start:865 stop:1101 length:237 start_codon:yes stop_codon:yes gene_type:complete
MAKIVKQDVNRDAFMRDRGYLMRYHEDQAVGYHHGVRLVVADTRKEVYDIAKRASIPSGKIFVGEVNDLREDERDVRN